MYCPYTDSWADVLEVLLAEFKATLIRKGFRRADIKERYELAKSRLEDERRDPTGKLMGRDDVNTHATIG